MSMQLSTRRAIGGLVRAGLVVLAVLVAGIWLANRVKHRERGGLPSAIVRSETINPGDVRIVSAEGGVSITLQGNRVLAGLSPATIAKVRGELERSAAKDTSGLGGSIAKIVKQTVSENISAQVAYAVADIREVTYEDGRIVLHMNDGKTNRLFENAKVSNERPVFSSEDAERFIAAFNERKQTAP